MNEVTKQATEQQFNAIYKEYKPLIELYLRTKISDEEVRNDIISETFIRVFKYLETFNPDKSKLTTWIHTIARNLLIDEIRKSKNKPINEADLSNDNEDGKTFEFTDYDKNEIADNKLENKELRNKIDSALQTIKPTYREVAIQYFVHEQKYTEIAENLNMPLNTVKVAILRAKETLQSVLRLEYASL